MSGESIKLQYKNKESLKRIISTTSNASLKIIGSFGPKRLDNWENMLIWGDNLEGLRLLLKDQNINEKIRLIYIDPPFATNNEFKRSELRTSTISYSLKDDNSYEDKIIGTRYIEFLRKRLALIREIMSKEGSMYLHIDCKMGHYVKVLMDEIFGQERFINEITRIKCNPKNFKRKGYGNIKDVVLFYSKTDKYAWKEPRVKMDDDDIKRLYPKIDKDGRKYTTTPLHAPGETRNGDTGKIWKGLKPPRGRHWRYSPQKLDNLDKQGLIEWSSSGNPRKKIYADEMDKNGKKLQDIWRFKDPPYPTYPTEKNLEMLKVILEASSNPDDIVLDCFSGSGTTLVAAEKLERRWIGIDSSKSAIDTAQKRLLSIKDHSAFSIYKIVEES